MWKIVCNTMQYMNFKYGVCAQPGTLGGNELVRKEEPLIRKPHGKILWGVQLHTSPTTNLSISWDFLVV